MAGKTRYDLAIKKLEPYNNTILNIGELRILIIKHLGSNPSTINGYLKMLRETGVIEEIEGLRFKINIPKNAN